MNGRLVGTRILLMIFVATAVGCANFPLPKTMTDESVAVKQKKRAQEFTQQFDEKRDFAEYEAANNYWVHQRDPKGCREALTRLLARKPDHREARLLMVELLLSEENAPAAYEQAKYALDKYPNDAQVQYTVALTLDGLGKNADALPYYERATHMDPHSEVFAAAYQTARDAAREEVRQTRSTTVQTTSFFDQPGEATVEAKPVGYAEQSNRLEKTPTPAAGRNHINGRNDSDDSFQNVGCNEAAELLQRGQKALLDGAVPAATELFRQAAALRPDNPQIPLSAAAASLKANHPEVAVNLLVPAAQQFPQLAAIHRMLGVAFYRQGDYKSSQVALQQALSLDKSSPLSYLLMGWTLTKLGQSEAAEAHFRQAKVLDPRYGIVR